MLEGSKDIINLSFGFDQPAYLSFQNATNSQGKQLKWSELYSDLMIGQYRRESPKASVTILVQLSYSFKKFSEFHKYHAMIFISMSDASRR